MEQIESQIDNFSSFSKYNIEDILFDKNKTNFDQACMSVLAELVVRSFTLQYVHSTC